jgi:hypothetical protein
MPAYAVLELQYNYLIVSYIGALTTVIADNIETAHILVFRE